MEEKRCNGGSGCILIAIILRIIFRKMLITEMYLIDVLYSVHNYFI